MKSVREVRVWLEGNVQDEPFVIYEVTYDGETRLFLKKYMAVESAHFYCYPGEGVDKERIAAAHEALHQGDSYTFESEHEGGDGELHTFRTANVWKREVS